MTFEFILFNDQKIILIYLLINNIKEFKKVIKIMKI